MITSFGKKHPQQSGAALQSCPPPPGLDLTALFQSLETITNRLECLENQRNPVPQQLRQYGPRPRNPSRRVVGPCYKCGQMGHLQRNCPSNLPHPTRPVSQPPNTTPINFSFTSTPSSHSVPFVAGFVDAIPVTFLVDSGAAISLVRYDVLPPSLRSQVLNTQDATLAVSASGHSLDVLGRVSLPLDLDNVHVTHVFTVVQQLAVDALLCIDFLTFADAVVNCKKGCLSLGTVHIPFITPCRSCGDACPKHRETCSPSSVSSVTSPVMLIDTVEIPGRSVQFVQARLQLKDRQPLLHGTLEGLLEPSHSSAIPKHIMVARSLNKVNTDMSTYIQVTNVSPGKIQLSRDTPIGSFIPISNVFAVNINCKSEPVSNNPCINPPTVDLTSSALSPQEQEQLHEVLQSYHDVFATPNGPLGRTSAVQHHIRTTGPPIRQPMRRIPIALKDTVNYEVCKMLDSGVIRPSSSPWSAPLVMVQKKDNSWRFCIDYRKLNNVTDTS